jgi:hypothetical protein
LLLKGKGFNVSIFLQVLLCFVFAFFAIEIPFYRPALPIAIPNVDIKGIANVMDKPKSEKIEGGSAGHQFYLSLSRRSWTRQSRTAGIRDWPNQQSHRGGTHLLSEEPSSILAKEAQDMGNEKDKKCFYAQVVARKGFLFFKGLRTRSRTARHQPDISGRGWSVVPVKVT